MNIVINSTMPHSGLGKKTLTNATGNNLTFLTHFFNPLKKSTIAQIEVTKDFKREKIVSIT